MLELLGKRWFQVISVIVLFVAFFVVMHYVRREPRVELSNIVAKINGVDITRLEYQAAISRRTMRIFNRDRMVRASDREKIHLDVFKALANDKVLESEAKELNIQVTSKDIDDRVNLLKMKFVPQQRERMYKAFLETMGYRTEDELRNELRYEIFESKLTDRMFPRTKYKVTHKEIQEYIPTIKLQQIYLPMPYDAPPGQDINNAYEKVEELAKDIARRAAAGENFGDLAVKYSQDKSVSATRGEIGWVSKNMVVPEFWRVASSLSPGQMSEPFKTRYGIHIIKCEARMGPGDPPYERMKTGYRAAILLRKQKAAFAAWFARKIAKLQEEKDGIILYDHLLLANRYKVVGKLDKAIDEYKEVIKENPDNPYFHVDVAELLGRQGKKNEAMKEFRKATEIAPMDGALYFRIGEVYMGYGEHEKALREFRRASDLSRLDHEIHLRLQNIYTQLGLMQEAEDEHQRYLKAIELLGGNKMNGQGAQPVEPGAESPMPNFGITPEQPQPELPLRAPGSR